MDILQLVRDRVKRKYEKKEEPKSQTKKGEWFCSQCQLRFNSEEEFKKHKRKYHKLSFGMR